MRLNARPPTSATTGRLGELLRMYVSDPLRLVVSCANPWDTAPSQMSRGLREAHPCAGDPRCGHPVIRARPDDGRRVGDRLVVVVVVVVVVFFVAPPVGFRTAW